jgi:hypothetical protein
VSPHLKIKLNLPNNYFDLSPDEKIFFDELLDNKDVKEIEILKQSYKQIVTHIDGFVDSLEKVDSILYSEE